MSTTRRPVGRPTADTLTDRYVWAVLKSLPEGKRSDIDRELRASIADDVDARAAAGETPEAAERAVLTELGEPMRLAAGYAGRPLALIGPDLYVDYVRLLKLLLVIVLPIVVLTTFVINALTGAEPGELVGGAIGIALSVGVHMCFWVTLVFAIVELRGSRRHADPGDQPRPRGAVDVAARGRQRGAHDRDDRADRLAGRDRRCTERGVLRPPRLGRIRRRRKPRCDHRVYRRQRQANRSGGAA